MISSNPLLFMTWPRMINSGVSMWSDANKQKYLSKPNLSGNWIFNSFAWVKIGWLAVSTVIWPWFKVLIVFDLIFIQWYCISKVWTGSSIGSKIALMSGIHTTDQCFPAWYLCQGTQEEALSSYALYNRSYSSVTPWWWTRLSKSGRTGISAIKNVSEVDGERNLEISVYD